MTDNPIPIDPDAEVGLVARPSARAPGAPRERRWDVALVIAAGGAIGSIARWGLNEALPHGSHGFPWSTFLENVSGALVIGVLIVFLIDVWPTTRYGRPFLAVGILGGYTTFSTYMVDTRTLLAAGEGLLALSYLFGTLAVGLVATWAGLRLGRGLAGVPHRRVFGNRRTATEEPS